MSTYKALTTQLDRSTSDAAEPMTPGNSAARSGLALPDLTPLFWRNARTDLGRRKLKQVGVVILVQMLIGTGCVLVGLAELVVDGPTFGAILHLVLGALLVLLFGLSVEAANVLMREVHKAERARAIAAGAFAPFVQQRFETWGLTPAEHDVAMFTLKGFETQEIADLRDTCQATVRVQLARVYEKAGVGSRCAFQSMFFEDLLERADGAGDAAA